MGLADYLVCDAPLVVIPRHHLDQRLIDDLSEFEVNDGGVRVTDDDCGHEQASLTATNVAVTFARSFAAESVITSAELTSSAADP